MWQPGNLKLGRLGPTQGRQRPGIDRGTSPGLVGAKGSIDRWAPQPIQPPKASWPLRKRERKGSSVSSASRPAQHLKRLRLGPPGMPSATGSHIGNENGDRKERSRLRGVGYRGRLGSIGACKKRSDQKQRRLADEASEEGRQGAASLSRFLRQPRTWSCAPKESRPLFSPPAVHRRLLGVIAKPP